MSFNIPFGESSAVDTLDKPKVFGIWQCHLTGDCGALQSVRVGMGFRTLAASNKKHYFERFTILTQWATHLLPLTASCTHINTSLVRSLPSIPTNERNEFARGLPLEILSDLVVAMAELPAVSAFATAPVYPTPLEAKHALSSGETSRPPAKRARKSAPNPVILDEVETKPIIKKVPRKSEPVRRKQPIFPKEPLTKPDNWTTATDIEYCKDLIDRMIRGPGYWTRLVGPFRHPVDPDAENIPNYFDVIKKPMDLTTISQKVHGGEYKDGSGFEKDIRQIHKNCYEYWTKEDPIWKQCQDFENYFNTQWGERYKWTPGSKFHKQLVKSEVIE